MMRYLPSRLRRVSKLLQLTTPSCMSATYALVLALTLLAGPVTSQAQQLSQAPATASGLDAAIQAMVPGGRNIGGWCVEGCTGRIHHGVDIQASMSAPVYAFVPGVIARVGIDRLGGNVVYLRDDQNRRHYYAHFDRPSSQLREGQRVAPGDLIGHVRMTGNAVGTVPHVHFQITMPGGDWADPAVVLANWSGNGSGGGSAAGGCTPWDIPCQLRQLGQQMDPRRMAAEAFNAVLTSLMQTSIEQLQDWVTQMYTGAHNFIFRTPESLTYSHDGVMGLWNSMRTLANAALMLVALWGGFNLMAGPHLDTPYHEAMELLPRLVVGALLVNTSGWWTRLVIDLNNALCLTLDITTLPGTEQLDTAENALILLFGSLVYVVMGVLLVLQNLLRLAMVAALIVLSPLSLLCWVLPQTQGRSRMWTSMYVNTVLTQFVQLVVLKLGTVLFLTGFLTGEGKVAALMGPVLGSVVLYVVLKVPKLMRSQMDSPLGMVRYVLVSQGVRTVTRGVSRAALGSR